MGTKFVFWLVLDNARKQAFACHGGVGVHERLKSCRAYDSFTKAAFDAALGAQWPGRKLPCRKDRRREAAGSLVSLAIGGIGLQAPLMFRGLFGTMRSDPLDNVSPIRTTLRHFKRPFRYVSGQVGSTRQRGLIDARLGVADIHDAFCMPELHFTCAGQRQLSKLTAKRHHRAAP